MAGLFFRGFNTPRIPVIASKVMAFPGQVDFLIVGAGVAGLRAAVELARVGEVLVVTKESLGESNTHYAQGGIAVAMDGRHDIDLHLQDTITAGDGLVYRAAAETLVAEGPLRVGELIDWGARFDRKDGSLLRTREAAHSVPRILHADGDATGAEISRSLVTVSRAQRSIRFAEWTTVSGLICQNGRVVGADLLGGDKQPRRVGAAAVLIAAGGAGQVYSDTTNPAVATGDGIALAASVGAELADMEFYQFHPTALFLPGAPRFLLSEALRGEGAYLRNDRGERFMERYHPGLELAPRDVVARAVAREGMRESGGEPRPVYLDMRHVRGIDLRHRFPGISAFLAQYGLDLGRDLVPIRPAAHYLMGGVHTNLDGRTSVDGLFVAGEAACTGVHGANRLASNSLLEGLVFGARAAKAMIASGGAAVSLEPPAIYSAAGSSDEEFVEICITDLQRAMWECAGLLRDETALRHGLSARAKCKSGIDRIVQQGKTSRRLSEAQALCGVSDAILQSAQARTESRGAHFRSDYPHRDDRSFQKHSIIGRSGADPVVFEAW
jgi:L-aspartate oxidase